MSEPKAIYLVTNTKLGLDWKEFIVELGFWVCLGIMVGLII